MAFLNSLVFLMSGSLVAHMNDYLGGLFALANDFSVEVQRLVCQGILLLLSQCPDYLNPYTAIAVDFMLHATGNRDPDMALEV